MNCCYCTFYTEGETFNRCGVTYDECFRRQEHCTLVNDDGTINADDEYFKQE